MKLSYSVSSAPSMQVWWFFWASLIYSEEMKYLLLSMNKITFFAEFCLEPQNRKNEHIDFSILKMLAGLI